MSSIQDRLNAMRSGSASGAGNAVSPPAPQTSSIQDRLAKMRTSGQPSSKTAVPITTDLSGEAWTRATPSQTKVPGAAASGQSDVSRLQEQRRQAQVDMDTDAVARIDKQLELLRSEDGTGFSAGKLAYGTIQQGADRAATGIVRTAAQYVEKPLMTAVGAVLGDPEMPDRAPLHKLSGWMDSRAEQRQAEYQENADKGGKAAQIINKWGTATAAALPSAIMAVMSGGTSAAAQGTTKALQAASALEQGGGIAATVQRAVSSMAKDPQYWSSFAQVAGDSYEQAKADGASEMAANLYGVANGLLNAAEEVGGGIQTLPSELQKGGSALRSWIKSMVDEGREEVVQGAIERGLQNLTYQKGNPLASVTDQNAVLNPRTALEEFKGGAIVGGILGGGQVLAGKAVESAQNRQNGALDAAGTPSVETEGNFTSSPQNGSQAVSGGIMEQEVQRLFGQQKAASTGETANSGKSVTLNDLLFGGKRVDQAGLTQEQFDAAVQANEQGTVGMDADNKVYQVNPEQHIDRRTADSVGSRNMNAFQFDHPELHGYYQRAANALIADADLSLQFPMVRRYERTMQGNKTIQGAQASEHLRMAMDETGLSRAELIDAAQRIINDQGQENVKAAKQVEVILDFMLTNGWTTMTGETVSPNEAYIRDKGRIAGSQPATKGGEGLPMMDDGLGAKTSQFKRGEKTSKAKSVYDEADNATDQQRTYDITSDAERLNTARERLQVDYDGEKQYLRNAAEWNGEDYAVAKLIQSDIRKQAQASGDFSEFRAWSMDIQKHASFFGQDLQSLKMWVKQSADKAVSDAAAVLDAAKENESAAPVRGKAKVTDDVINSALGDIAEFGTRAENLTNAGDAAGLYDLVIELANYRGYKPSKSIQKALKGCTVEQLTDIAWSEISGISIDAIPPSAGQYISTYQYLSHLLNAKTLLRNVTANSVFSPIESAFTNNIASIVDRLAASVVGGYQGISTAQARTVGMEKGPFSKAGWKGSIEGAKQSAIDVALDINRGNSQNKYEAGTNRTFKRHNTGDPLLDAILNTGNNLEGVLGYGLNTTDEFQKGGTAAKVKESLKGILGTEGSRVTPEMAEQFVKNEQLYRSFQRDTAIGNLLQASKDYLNIIGFGTSNGKTKNVAGHSFAVKDFGLGDFISKYTRVPGALVTTVAEYTDLGYSKAIYNLGAMAYTNAQVKSGRGDAQVGGHFGAYSGMTNADAAVYSQRAFAQNIARVLTGKGLMLACASLAKMGILHFTGDDDRDEATVKATQGLSGLQINLSALGRLVDGGDGSMQDGDIMLDASSLEPVNALMEGGARMAELEDDADYSAKMNILADTIVNSFADLSMMQSAKDVKNAVSYKRDDETWGDVGKDVLSEILLNSANGFVPGPVRQAATYSDDYYRDTSSDTQADRIKNSLISSVPGLRETLPERVTPLGEKRKKTTGGGLDFFTSFISPLNITKYRQSDVVDAMDETGVYAARSAPKTVTANGKTLELSADQKRRYQGERGTELILTVSNMLGNRQYKQAGDAQKQDLMADAREYANYIAKANVLGKDSVPQWVQKTMEAQKTIGIPTATVIVYRDMLSREKSNGQSTSEANSTVRNAIQNDATMSAAQKAALDDIVISDGVYIAKDLNVDYTNNETFIISQMSDGAQKRYAGIKNRFGMDAETYKKAWAIYQNDSLKADQKRQRLSALGYNGSALYKALGQKLG